MHGLGVPDHADRAGGGVGDGRRRHPVAVLGRPGRRAVHARLSRAVPAAVHARLGWAIHAVHAGLNRTVPAVHARLSRTVRAVTRGRLRAVGGGRVVGMGGRGEPAVRGVVGVAGPAGVVVGLGDRDPGPARARRLRSRRLGVGGDPGRRGVEPATQRPHLVLGPLGRVERLVAALSGGNDLGAQLPAQPVHLVPQLLGLTLAAAVGAQRDRQADQHHGEDREHGGEAQRPVTVCDQQDQRRDGSERHADPEDHGQQSGLSPVADGNRSGHGCAAYRVFPLLGTP
ncbi:hypothetical protein MCAG_02410 [Micromonospora sp. ATCC 39149]|nr:hypothetical protein MCAG_02410 [Micromonospora sp. ATCC 39149]